MTGIVLRGDRAAVTAESSWMVDGSRSVAQMLIKCLIYRFVSIVDSSIQSRSLKVNQIVFFFFLKTV